MKISLHTAQKLLDDADDLWVGGQSSDWHTLNIGAPPEYSFFESEYEDASGLVFEYKAYGEDNTTVVLEGCTMTLVGREDDGETIEFDITLLKQWDAEAYLGRDGA